VPEVPWPDLTTQCGQCWRSLALLAGTLVGDELVDHSRRAALTDDPSPASLGHCLLVAVSSLPEP
jgi:hypothetical protein